MGVVLPQPIQFGKYTLFERIGRGGMADVFKARVQGPAGFERVFVVKRILPHLSDDPQFNKMFVEEAKLSARLNHPNVVQVFELGSVEGEYFISMEHVRGRDLAETMRTLWARVGPPRPELVAYIGREMCRALGYAHDLTGDDGAPIGMIHRDVSPSNVMLSYEGAVKLLDFGIAKALGGDQKDEGTQRGTLKGKFAYMAPEQTQGNDVDRRIDIFATGIVLHEILTGRRLFKGENDLQTVEKVRQCDVPPPSLQNPLCPPELDAIVLKALAKNRDDRFQTAGEMADALDDIVHVARFQPTHLAQLMRDLFPGEAGGPDTRNATGSVRVSQSMPSTTSRPYPTAMRSPTIPPVSVSRTGALPAATSDLQTSGPLTVLPRPFYLRPGFLLLALLVFVGAAFGAGIYLTPSKQTVVVQGSAGVTPDGQIAVEFDSLPTGADAVDVATGRVICSPTPCRGKVEWKATAPPVVVLRKDGYEEVKKEVRPGLRLYATLRPRLPGAQRAANGPKVEQVDSRPAPPPTEKPSEKVDHRGKDGEGKAGGTSAPAPAAPPPVAPSTGAASPSGGKTPTSATPPSTVTPPAGESSGKSGSGGRRRSGSGRGTPPSTDLVNPF